MFSRCFLVNKVKTHVLSTHGCFYRGNEKQTFMTLKNINFVLLANVTFIKSTLYLGHHFFSGVGEKHLFEGGPLFQILSLRRGLIRSGALI